MNYLKIISPFILLITITLQVNAQIQNIAIDKSYNQLEWDAFVEKVEANEPVRFFYDTDSISDIKIEITGENTLLFDVLQRHLSPAGYRFSTIGKSIFIVKNDSLSIDLPESFFQKQNYTLIDSSRNGANGNGGYLRTSSEYLSDVIVVGTKNADNKSTAVINGYVRNASDGTPIVGSTLYLEEIEKATATDANGFFSIEVKKDNYTLIVRSLENKAEKYDLRVYSSGDITILLNKKVIALDEVIVRSEKFDNVRSTRMGFEKLSAKQVNEIPLALGEKDIVKVSLLLPGIQTVGEGASGFNVRGSPTDQNIFYIQNIPVYNTSHSLGFFSAFNSDAIDELTLYKSNVPARYGGRLSSVFEIKTRQGNNQNFSMSGGISPITGRLLVEGPIVKNKLSYLVAARSTYSDWLLDQVKNTDIQNSSVQFSDFMSNLNWNINTNNSLKWFTYYSTDNIRLTEINQYDYQNTGTSFSWNRIIAGRHSLNVHGIYSQYDFIKENNEIAANAYRINYGLKHWELKTDISIQTNENHELIVGGNSILYQIDQGDYLPLNENSLITPQYLNQEKAIESGIFISDEWRVTEDLSAIIGLRYNHYAYLGEHQVFTYEPNMPLLENTIEDTLNFSDNEIVKSYQDLDFRIAAKYMLGSNASVKASYNRMHQYAFMLSNSIAISPTDKWKLCDYHIEPLEGDQYSIGLFTNFFNNAIEFSAEAYMKKVKNLVEYKDGANLEVNTVPETEVLQGNLDAYGFEIMLKKPYGRFNGWVNYTYSSAKVLVDNAQPEEQINFGLEYPANYDKPHAVNLVLNYKFTRRVSVSANAVYSTGRPITYPTGIYYLNETQFMHYSKRNEYRIPDYFRLDMAVKIEGNLKSDKLAHGTWLFSVYNLTGRDNAYSVYFKSESGYVNGYKLSIFAVPIFSVSYNFKLGNYAD